MGGARSLKSRQQQTGPSSLQSPRGFLCFCLSGTRCPPSLHLCLRMAFLLVCLGQTSLCLSLTKTPAIGLQPSTQEALLTWSPTLNDICKGPFSTRGHIHRCQMWTQLVGGEAQLTPPCCSLWVTTLGPEPAQGRGTAEGDREGEDGLGVVSGRVARLACERGREVTLESTATLHVSTSSVTR